MQNSAETIFTPKDGNPALTSLHEISMPADINWLPQTIGWQVILLLVICYLLYRIYLRVDKYISNAYRRAALIELTACGDEAADFERISKILRRTALYAFDRTQVAPLIGEKWETWLDQQATGTDFSGELKGLLSQLAYAPPTSIQSGLSAEKLSLFKSQAVLWVKSHRGHYG